MDDEIYFKIKTEFDLEGNEIFDDVEFYKENKDRIDLNKLIEEEDVYPSDRIIILGADKIDHLFFKMTDSILFEDIEFYKENKEYIDLNTLLLKNIQLSNEIIDLYSDEIDFNLLIFRTFRENIDWIFDKYFHKINFVHIFSHINNYITDDTFNKYVNEDTLDKHIDKIHRLEIVVKRCNLSYHFVEKHYFKLREYYRYIIDKNKYDMRYVNLFFKDVSEAIKGNISVSDKKVYSGIFYEIILKSEVLETGFKIGSNLEELSKYASIFDKSLWMYLCKSHSIPISFLIKHEYYIKMVQSPDDRMYRLDYGKYDLLEDFEHVLIDSEYRSKHKDIYVIEGLEYSFKTGRLDFESRFLKKLFKYGLSVESSFKCLYILLNECQRKLKNVEDVKKYINSFIKILYENLKSDEKDVYNKMIQEFNKAMIY